MITRPRTNSLLTLMVVGMTLMLATAVRAQDQRSQDPGSAAATLRVNFGSPHHWASVQGTHVEELPAAERPDYDMFRYGSTYYAYNNHQWYMSSRERGDFARIDDQAVPTEFSSVPRDHWRDYPTAWQDRQGPAPAPVRASATLRLNFGGAGHWLGIPGTQVEELPPAERPDHDVFRYGGAYYTHENDRWYMSGRADGNFTAIDDRDVPRDFSNIPRDHWRNYPGNWQDRHDRGMRGAPETMQVNVGYSARWSMIRGTRVQQLRGRSRPDYDLFRYGGDYYAFDNDRWFTSHSGRGEYVAIGYDRVPDQMRRIPRDAWRNYPARWLDENGNPRYDRFDRRPDGERNR